MNDKDIEAMFSGRVRSEDVIVEYLPENSWGSYGDFRLVGHGKVTNEYCGKFRKMYGCSRVELHNRKTLDGVNFKDTVFFKSTFFSCDRPSCPVCYRYGWAVREARSIEARLKEASKRFGLVEHIVCSIPPEDYGLSYEAMRRKVDKVLKSRGIMGSAKIFHAFRYDLNKHWYWSPHFHVLGFVLGGYGKCRHCKRKWNCLAGCGGFDDRSYQNFLKDNYFVKVLSERKSVYATAWYQLHHSSIDVSKKRFHVVTWSGVVSYRKLKFTAERRKALCPICGHELVEHWYNGNNPKILAILSSDRSSCALRKGLANLIEDGRVAWIERVKKHWGSGSYACA